MSLKGQTITDIHEQQIVKFKKQINEFEAGDSSTIRASPYEVKQSCTIYLRLFEAEIDARYSKHDFTNLTAMVPVQKLSICLLKQIYHIPYPDQ